MYNSIDVDGRMNWFLIVFVSLLWSLMRPEATSAVAREGVDEKQKKRKTTNSVLHIALVFLDTATFKSYF